MTTQVILTLSMHDANGTEIHPGDRVLHFDGWRTHPERHISCSVYRLCRVKEVIETRQNDNMNFVEHSIRWYLSYMINGREFVPLNSWSGEDIFVCNELEEEFLGERFYENGIGGFSQFPPSPIFHLGERQILFGDYASKMEEQQ